MKKVISSIIAVVLLGLIASEASAARKFVVCYRFVNAFVSFAGEPCESVLLDEVIKLNIKKHSKLSTQSEETAFGHPKQIVYSIHGKDVGACGAFTVRPVIGTLHAIGTFRNPSKNPGEHRMGLEIYATTGCPNWCRDVEISCKSTGEGFPPQSWHCYAQNKFDVEFEFDLVMVNPAEDPACCLFEDGVDAFAEKEVKGPGSGLKMK